ncbi:MAG: hypothetical protein PHF03_04115, partial [Syntrophomonadaceae bacterium]|nr:hypothetical protein [Syntrophomonadaceae bacterium]
GNHYGQGRSGSIKPEKSQKALEQPRSGPNGQVNSSAGKKNKDAKSKMEVDKKKTNKIKSEPPGQQKKIKQDEKNSNNKGRS